MEKPIIATTLSGLFIKQEAWDKAHILWYHEREKELKAEGLDTSDVDNWRRLLKTNPEKEKREYFKFVDPIIKKLYPKLSVKEQTKKAREMFFDSVIEYIKQNTEVINLDILGYFQTLKNNYQIALVTTNTTSAINRILKISKLEKFFDLIETSKPEEKDDKRAVFDRFIKKYEKPILYIGGNKKDSFDYCKEKNIPCIFANLENSKEIKGVKSIHNLKELKSLINPL